jgi:4-deoxy-L-threo-5-hexosulose-uronate ketol-isomerase
MNLFCNKYFIIKERKMMYVLYGANPDDFRQYNTTQIRKAFLLNDLFKPGEMVLTYSHIDRMIAGSACPLKGQNISLAPGKELGSAFFLERREMGILNLGKPGVVKAGGESYSLRPRDMLYIGMGAKDVVFEGEGAEFYILSCPAHMPHPTTLIPSDKAVRTHLGSPKQANDRTIAKYLDPGVLETCQLAMGITTLEEGSVWNTMPSHTHERRMEIYLYVDLPEDAAVIHLMGQPEETRHIVVRDREAVISPSWSIHSGVGTCAYSFVWGMCGENQTFTDMDSVGMRDLY